MREVTEVNCFSTVNMFALIFSTLLHLYRNKFQPTGKTLKKWKNIVKSAILNSRSEVHL